MKPDGIVTQRASAYDEVYSRWSTKRVTVESFERWARFFLEPGAGRDAHINGDEIGCAMRLLDVDHIRGKRVLDYCCGVGRSSIYLALRGARVSAFDASERAIAIARESAVLSDVAEQLQLDLADAQRLPYPSNEFDLVYCQSALHIVADYPSCATELARVLKPGGRAVFCEEALGHNLVFEIPRRMRRAKYKNCGGRPLTYHDIRQFGDAFDRVSIFHFNLLLQIKTLMGHHATRDWGRAALRRLQRLDRRVLECCPWARRMCGKVVIMYENPRNSGTGAPSGPAPIAMLSGHGPPTNGAPPNHSRPTSTGAGRMAHIDNGSQVDIAFIMSASHSGSTLLAFLLGSHPQATTVGDTEGTPTRKDPNYLCSCGALAKECGFWSQVGQEMSKRGLGFDATDFGTAYRMGRGWFVDRVLRMEYRGRILEGCRDTVLSLSPAWQSRFEECSQRYVALVESLASIGGKRVLVDSSKQPHRLKHLLRIPDLHIKVVQLVRDGRGVVDTYLKTNQWSVKKSSEEWKRSILAEERLLKRLGPDQWICVRYEDLCQSPRAVLERLCTFLNIDPALVNLDFRASGLHVFGNAMRLSKTSRVILDDEWKRSLGQDELRIFERVAGSLSRKYGYE